MRIALCHRLGNIAVRVLIVAAMLWALGSCVTQEPVHTKSSWQTVAGARGTQPVPRHEAGYAKVQGRFYLLGGRGVRPVSIFDPATRLWREGAKPPLELHHFQPVAYRDKVFVVGAFTGKFPAETPVPNIYVYSPSADKWQIGPQIPLQRQRGSAGAVAYQGKLYLICGIRNGHVNGHTKWFDVYDPASNSWAVLADAPRPRDHFQAVVLGDRLYLAGGRLTMAPHKIFSETIREVDVFDFKTGRWSTLSQPLPTPRAGVAAFAWREEVVVVGGESMQQATAHSEVEALNVNTKTWRRLPGLRSGRHGTGVVVHKGVAYIASGSGNRGGAPELANQEKLVLQ